MLYYVIRYFNDHCSDSVLFTNAHLDYMQLGQQVTVSKGHFITIQEVAVGDLDVLDAVVVDLIRQG